MGSRLKFALGDAILLDSDEWVGRLEDLVTEAVQRAEQIEAQRLEEQRLREEDPRAREEAPRRREALEQEVAALRRKLMELKDRS